MHTLASPLGLGAAPLGLVRVLRTLQPRASELTRLPRKPKPVLSDKEKEKLQKEAAAKRRQDMVSLTCPSPTHHPQGTPHTSELDLVQAHCCVGVKEEEVIEQ